LLSLTSTRTAPRLPLRRSAIRERALCPSRSMSPIRHRSPRWSLPCSRHFGRIDILVNNAGVGGNTPFLDTSLEDWNRIIGINLTGAFLVAQAVACEMVKTGGGKIVNIASLSGQRGGNGRAAYGSAKAGLELLTKVMAVELAPYNINVNNIAPGAIETEMAKFAHDPATRTAYNYLIPMSRYGTPEEIADAAVFLCSDESRYIHGHTLNVASVAEI
jgi:NAD(P)-dependent dehydrogenase (short-subunit alcohol dehydrogenase family)